MTHAGDASVDLEMLLRRIIREETGLTPVVPAEKWRGGTLVLRPGRPGVQEKSWPIDTFFHKVVMLRNRLRTLEQQLNGADLPDDLKVRLQGYITGCYGSLTSFNVLFADEDDQFKGVGRVAWTFVPVCRVPSCASAPVQRPDVGPSVTQLQRQFLSRVVDDAY